MAFQKIGLEAHSIMDIIRTQCFYMSMYYRASLTRAPLCLIGEAAGREGYDRVPVPVGM